MTSSEPPRLSVRSTADLIAAVPYLLGFHPTDSVVVVAMRGRRVIFAARGDLPAPGYPVTTREAAAQITAIVGRQRADAVTVLGYGPAARVTPAVDAVAVAMDGASLPVFDLLRVTDGRYWSYLCDNPECCPADGTPFDPSTSAVAAEATFAGQVALPDRAALAGRVAAVTGAERVALSGAAERAAARLVALLEGAPEADLLGMRTLRAAGAAAVDAAADRHRAGRRLTDDEVAWLGLLLTHVPVRDHAWEHIDGEEALLAGWSDVLRRVEPDLAAAPASLLAFAAWRGGQGGLAAVALDRAFEADPDYSMAVLLDDVLRRGVTPSALDDWPLLERDGSPAPSGRRARRVRSARSRGKSGRRPGGRVGPDGSGLNS